MKVLFTKSFLNDDLNYISKLTLKGIDLIYPASFTEEALIPLAEDADVLFGNLVTEKLLASAKKLKFIQIPWTGVDNLDFKLLENFNITVCNSHSNAFAVAEHAVALMMDAAKKISFHDHLLRKGEWNRVNSESACVISPFSRIISGSHVGIVGFGAIGQKIYNLLKGYTCKFKVFNKESVINFNDDPFLSMFSPEHIYTEIHDLDFVFVSVPLTNETRQLINNKFLSSMNDNAVLINISRGEVMNETDVYNALKTKLIGFAAIDTWFNYPSKDSPIVFPSELHNFHLLDNLVLSPHRAGYVMGGFPHLDDAIDNLNRLFQGNPLKNIVSLANRY